jgi:hypothetical protein
MMMRPVLFATLALTGAAACGDDNTSDPPGGDPSFLVGTRVWDDTATTSYFHLATSLEAGTVIDPRDAVEVPGSAKLFSIEGAGWFAIGGGESPTISEYTLDGGRLVEGVTISLQEYGVQSLWDTLYVVSPTKAYYPDRDGEQLIVWNPTTMEITGSIALPATARAGYLALYGYSPVIRGSDLLFTVGWFDWTNDTILAETGLVVIDTATDTVSRTDVDTRCGGITTGVTTASGDTYFVSSALAGAAFRVGRYDREPCALRLPAGGNAFDPSYLDTHDSIAGGAIAGEPVPAGGDAMYLRVLDEGLATVDPQGASWDVTGQLAWRWRRWDVPGTTTVAVDALAPSTADVLWFRVGDRVFGTETTSDYSETTLIDLTADGGPARALTAPGFLHGVARIQ